jgi:hypothetical protein
MDLPNGTTIFNAHDIHSGINILLIRLIWGISHVIICSDCRYQLISIQLIEDWSMINLYFFIYDDFLDLISTEPA